MRAAAMTENPPAADVLQQLLAPHMELSQDQARVVAASLRPVRFAAGERMYERGERCADAVVLTQGLARAYYIHGGKEINLRLLCAPAVAIAMSSVITGEPSTEWVEAITDVQGFRTDVRGLSASGQELLAERLMRILAEQHYLALERRLHMLQSKSVAERYAFFCEHMPPDIVARTPGYHIASYLAVTPETLSRVRKKPPGD